MASAYRIFGPYAHGEGWRCMLGDGKARKPLPTAETPEKARRIAESTIRILEAQTPVTLDEALDRYREFLLTKNKPETVTTSGYRLRRFFGDTSICVEALTARRCQDRYASLAATQKPDTHRNTLAEVKTFCRWLVEQKLIRSSPVESIKPTGRRSYGKETLTQDEAKSWLREALHRAEDGSDTALIAAMTMLMGLRPGEILVRTVRDVDCEGTRLRVRKTKTRAGDRDPYIPEALRPLIAARCRNKLPGALLFPAHSRSGEPKPHNVASIRKAVKSICQAVRVPIVCTYSMRGLYADMAVESYGDERIAAKLLGHTNPAVTMKHYAKPSTLHDIHTARVNARLGN